MNKRAVSLGAALCLMLGVFLGLAAPVSADTVSGYVNPSGVFDMSTLEFVDQNAGLEGYTRYSVSYSPDTELFYWANNVVSSTNTSYDNSTVSFTAVSASTHIYPSGYQYLKLPVDGSYMMDIELRYAISCYSVSSTSLAAITPTVSAEFIDADFNSLGSRRTTLSSRSIPGLSVNPVQEFVFSFTDVPEGAVYFIPRFHAAATSRSVKYMLSDLRCDLTWTMSNEYVGTPNVPNVISSFEGQNIVIAADESANLFVSAGNINGEGSIVWERKNVLEDDWVTIHSQSLYYDSAHGVHYGAWAYTPSSEGVPYTILLRAVVTNSLGVNSESYTTGNAVITVTSDGELPEGSGSDGATAERLEELDSDIQEVQDAVSAVGDKVDDLTGQVEEEMGVVQDQLEESNNKLEEVVEGVTSLPQKIGEAIMGLFVPSEEDMAGIKDQWAQLLSDRFGAVYDAVAIVDEIASSFKEQTTQGTITFPSVSIPLSGVDFEFGGWEVDVVPDGLEPFIQAVKKAIDIVCTLLFVNGMKSRYEKTLEGRG